MSWLPLFCVNTLHHVVLGLPFSLPFKSCRVGLAHQIVELFGCYSEIMPNRKARLGAYLPTSQH